MDIRKIIIAYLETHDTISLDQAVQLVNQNEVDVPRSTIRWRLYDMVRKGSLQRIRRGVYTISKKREFSFHLSNRLVSYYTIAKEEMPFLKTCVWSSDVVKDLTRHHPNVSFDIVDTEKDGIESVKDVLLSNNIKACLYEDFPSLKSSLISDERIVVVKQLITESPVVSYSSVVVPRIEKLLVDIVCDDKIFEYLHGTELLYVYSQALERYNLQQDTLLRYARRRGAYEKINDVLLQINGKKN